MRTESSTSPKLLHSSQAQEEHVKPSVGHLSRKKRSSTTSLPFTMSNAGVPVAIMCLAASRNPVKTLLKGESSVTIRDCTRYTGIVAEFSTVISSSEVWYCRELYPLNARKSPKISSTGAIFWTCAVACVAEWVWLSREPPEDCPDNGYIWLVELAEDLVAPGSEGDAIPAIPESVRTELLRSKA